MWNALRSVTGWRNSLDAFVNKLTYSLKKKSVRQEMQTPFLSLLALFAILGNSTKLPDLLYSPHNVIKTNILMSSPCSLSIDRSVWGECISLFIFFLSMYVAFIFDSLSMGTYMMPHTICAGLGATLIYAKYSGLPRGCSHASGTLRILPASLPVTT